ncbi:MAG TPA: c-type cytochrome, partial [Pirellulales bacterium]|nr:c-type cytochrome [Pirellulales bacterium]
AAFDLAQESDEQLIERLRSPNVFYRDLAQRLLWERREPPTMRRLEQLVLNDAELRKARMHALWALIGCGPLAPEFHARLLAHADPGLRAWGVRAAGNQRDISPALREQIAALARDPADEVKLQVAIAAAKLTGVDSVSLLTDVLAQAGDDKLIPHIVWQNLHPLLETHSAKFLALVQEKQLARQPVAAAIMPRVVERMLASASPDADALASLFAALASGDGANPPLAGQCLAVLAAKIQTREIAGERLQTIKRAFEPVLQDLLNDSAASPLRFDAALLATTWRDPAGFEAIRAAFVSPKQVAERRLQALDALVAANDPDLLPAVAGVLNSSENASLELRRRTLDALGRLERADVAEIVLAAYPKMEAELKPQAIELLTGRAAWSKQLLAAIAAERLPAGALNVNQVRKLLASKDAELVKQVQTVWGVMRTERNPQREKVIAEMRTFVRKHPGDPHAGQQVFKKLCGQCHKIYGEGQEVGPDITVNGRSSFEQLLSNVFDPSLVIGAAYQARTVVTEDGRVLTGLVAEDSPQRVVLKIQGGKQETIARDNIEEMETSKLSLMPEDLEKQLKPAEIADLFAFITLNKPPSDPEARQLPGVRVPPPRETTNASEFNDVIGEIAPGFATAGSGERGVAIVAEHFGRAGVLRTHPIAQGKPCILRSTIDVPTGKRTRLLLDVSHDPRGDWQLVVKANGKLLHDGLVAAKTTKNGWSAVAIDLSRFAGQQVQLELLNQANGWSWEFGYWGRIEVVSE